MNYNAICLISVIIKNKILKSLSFIENKFSEKRLGLSELPVITDGHRNTDEILCRGGFKPGEVSDSSKVASSSFCCTLNQCMTFNLGPTSGISIHPSIYPSFYIYLCVLIYIYLFSFLCISLFIHQCIYANM